MKYSIPLLRAGLAAALFSLPQIASAASASWTGGGTTGAFSDGANWSTGIAPGSTSAAGNNDVATFNSATNTKVSIGGSRYIANLTLDTGAGAFTFSDGTVYTRVVNMNAGVTQSQTFYADLSGWASNADLSLTNNSTTLGAILNFRGNLIGSSNAALNPVNLGRGTGSGAIVWGNINDNVSKPMNLNLLDSGASMVMLRGSGSNFSGPTAIAKGAVFFESISNVGGGASSLGAPTTAANGKISISGGGRQTYLFYTGQGSVTDRAIENTSVTAGTGFDLSNVGTGALVWNGNYTNSSTTASTVNLGGFNTSENRYGGVIADGGTTATALTKFGKGVWNVSGTNTYTGATTVNDGVLRADFSAAGAPASNIISSSSLLTMNGGTFAVRGAATGTSSQTMNGLTLNRGGSSLVVDGNGGSGTTLNLNAITRALGGTLDVQTSGGGVVATSTTSMNNGVLASAASGGVAYATVNGSDWATISGGNIVALTSYQTATNPASWASTDNVSLSENPSAAIGTQTINTLKVAGAANLSIQSSKTLTLGAGGLLFTGTGAQSISGGSLTSGTTTKELVIRQNNTSSIVDISSAIAGAGMAVTKTGAGTLSLSGANTYTGTMTINEGVLKAGIGTGIPTSSITILNGGILGLTGNLSATISVFGGSGTRVGWSNSGGFAAYGGNWTVNLNSGAAITWGQNSVLTGNQALMLGAADADSTVIWTNAILLNPTASGNAVMREIRVAKGSAAAAADAEMSGVLSGAHSGLIKTGDGALRLTAANTYDGATIVSAGTLIVNGSINNSMLTMVYSGATLAGTGSSAQIELMAGGAMRPGDGGIGTFSTSQNGNSDMVWHGEASGAFAQMKFELSNTDATSDKIDLGAGVLNKADGLFFKFDFLGTGMANQTYTLLTFGSSLNFSVTDFSYTGLTSGLTGEFALTENALTFTTVPEPSTFAMIIGGLLALVIFRRRAARRIA
ncbi:hypothetical protein DB345_13700 [Spartobacteria bacterium LR76]|nr:hypothetical protein DB345_13700 [Spartobacteria bacterium LR76]